MPVAVHLVAPQVAAAEAPGPGRVAMLADPIGNLRKEDLGKGHLHPSHEIVGHFPQVDRCPDPGFELCRFGEVAVYLDCSTLARSPDLDRVLEGGPLQDLLYRDKLCIFHDHTSIRSITPRCSCWLLAGPCSR